MHRTQSRSGRFDGGGAASGLQALSSAGGKVTATILQAGIG
jgi:hypothetical protein